MPSPQCPECGSALAASAAQGLCPRCLMEDAAQPSEPASRSVPPSVVSVTGAFPHLEVEGIIGHGGMGAVYKVRQPKLDRLAALKLLPQSVVGDGAFAARFEREAKLLARLSHPNIVSVYDYGQAGGFFYLLMEFVDGVNLRQAMRASRFTPAQALGIVPRICDALQYAHDEGVLHRDIKPENILLDAKGRVKLADFGIAKLAAEETLGEPETARGGSVNAAELTQTGTALGTPHYMAPEQRESPSDVDNRADIYSLGVVFYELLTGELPKGAFSPPSTKCQADPRVDAIVQQALEKDRARRQHSAAEVRTQVEGIHAATVPSSPKRPPRRWRKKLVSIGVALALLAIIRTFFVQPFRVPTDALAPEIPAGSHVLVWKPARTFAPGDLIVWEMEPGPYRQLVITYVGRVVRSEGESVIVNRNQKPDIAVPRSSIVGKVISVYWRAERKAEAAKTREAGTDVETESVEAPVTSGSTRDAVGEMAAGFAKMMATNPKMREMLKSETRMGIDLIYRDLSDLLELKEPRRSTFEKLIKERASVGLEAGLALLEGNKTAEDRKATAAEVKSKMADLDGQIKDLLGKEDYEELLLYEDSAPERLQLKAFDTLLTSKDMSLDESTETKLMAVMSRERERFPFASSYVNLMNPDISRFTPGNMSRFRSEYAQLNDNIAEQAAGILTAEQLGVLRQSQEEQMTVINMQLGVAVRMFSGPDNQQTDAPAP